MITTRVMIIGFDIEKGERLHFRITCDLFYIVFMTNLALI